VCLREQRQLREFGDRTGAAQSREIEKGHGGIFGAHVATNVMPLIQLGLVPVPIDVELDTLNVSSKKIVERLADFRSRDCSLRIFWDCATI